MLIRRFTHLLMSSIWKRFVLVGLVLGVICSTFAFPIPTDAYSRQSYECHDGSDNGRKRFQTGSGCDYLLRTYGCGDHDDRPGYRESDPMVDNDPVDTFHFCHTTPPPDAGDPPGDKGYEPPYRCRNFEELWSADYEVRLPGGTGRTEMRDFTAARLFIQACYNGQQIYIQGSEGSFNLSNDAQGRGFRPLPQHNETTRIPHGLGPDHKTSSSARVRYSAYFALPNGGLSAAGVSALGFGANAGFRDNGAEVRYAEYAINIDPHGCYVYAGGGSQKKCPHGKYGGN